MVVSRWISSCCGAVSDDCDSDLHVQVDDCDVTNARGLHYQLRYGVCALAKSLYGVVADLTLPCFLANDEPRFII